jgi:hypothetical protein
MVKTMVSGEDFPIFQGNTMVSSLFPLYSMGKAMVSGEDFP